MNRVKKLLLFLKRRKQPQPSLISPYLAINANTGKFLVNPETGKLIRLKRG